MTAQPEPNPGRGGYRKNAGGKPSCHCGNCRTCKVRTYRQRYEAKHPNRKPDQGKGRDVNQLSDQALEDLLTAYFLRKGWD
jgi:hypothetical protein